MRWWVLTLLFLATLVNYLDRGIFSVLTPVIRADLHFDEKMYGTLVFVFTTAYTLGYIIMGGLVDRLGTKWGYGIAAGIWTIAAGLHATVGSAWQFAQWRGLLGLAEAGNFPAAIKAVAEWFPVEQRALATGIFNSGTNFAQVIGPPIFLAMEPKFGWRNCFVLTASLGLIWLIAWVASYRTPAKAAIEEETKKVSWGEAVTYKQTWGFALGKFLTDPVWWFYLFWLPLYFTDVHHLDKKQLGWALSFIYLVACFGSMGGGWLSGFLMDRGWSKSKARKTAMFICAAAMPVAALGVLVNDWKIAVALFSIATSAHQGWSANLFTTTSDVFPKSAVGSVNGIGGCLGGLGGMIFSTIVPGYLIHWIGYTPLFLIISSFYLIALWVVHELMGDLLPLRVAPTVRTA